LLGALDWLSERERAHKEPPRPAAGAVAQKEMFERAGDCPHPFRDNVACGSGEPSGNGIGFQRFTQ